MSAKSSESAAAPERRAFEPAGARRAGRLLLLLALAVRLGYWAHVEQHPSEAIYNFHLVQGSPYADALHWDRNAARLAEGQNLESTGWEARRPFYAWFLALFYAWIGPSYPLAQLLNILTSCLTVWLLYDVGRRMGGEAVGLATGLWAVVNPEALSLGLITLTETLGLMLAVWHCRELCRGMVLAPRHLLYSGLLFAASNLTRTLTVLALPGYVVGIALLKLRATWNWRSSLRGAVYFGAGATSLLLPFMCLQWLNYGIFTLSNNTAGDLFAASSPTYRRWSYEVERLADEAGMVTIKERYEFFMAKARQNLREHRAFYLENMQATFVQAWTELERLALPGGWAAVAVPLLAALAWTETRRRRGVGAAANPPPPLAAADRLGLGVLCLGALAAALWITRIELADPAVTVTVLVAVTVLRALVLWPGDLTLLLVIYGAATLLAISMFGAVEPRLVFLLQWAIVLAYCLGLATIWNVAATLIRGGLAWMLLSRNNSAAKSQAPPAAVYALPHSLWPRRRLLAAGGLVFAGPLLLRQLLVKKTPPRYPELELKAALAALEAAVQLDPEVFAPAERERITAWKQRGHEESQYTLEELRLGMSCNDPLDSDGRLLVQRGYFDRHRYHFRAGEGAKHPTATFARREYARDVVHFDGIDVAAGTWLLRVIWPPTADALLPDQEYVLVARANPEMREWVHATAEGIVAFPVRPGSPEIDPATAIVCRDEQHRRLVRSWYRSFGHDA